MGSKAENILILGIGGVGMHLARRLLHEGASVTVIENDPKLVHEAAETMDARVIQGNSMRLSSWTAAEAESMELMIAATNDDATNMLSALIADRFGIPRKIVRVRSLDFEPGSVLPPEELKIDLMVHPEELLAQEIFRLVKRAACNDLIDIGNGWMQVLALRVDEQSPLVFKSPKELSTIHDQYHFRVVALARGISTIIPQADETIRPQDQVFILAHRDDMEQLMKQMRIQDRGISRMMILGGGLVGQRVAQLLEKEIEITLIENNHDRAEELAANLEKTQVIEGDGTDANVLVMAGMDRMESFVATTGDNETNIITCLLAKHLMNRGNREVQGAQGKTIALVDKEDHLVLSSTIGLDVVLNSKISAANEILKFIRRSELLSVAHLHGVDAEVVEVVASPGSEITKKPLKKLASYLKKYEIIIGGIHQNGNWEIAVGVSEVQPGSRVVLVCSSRNLRNIHKLF
ncbi:MAG: Trk system potassium transporter TrkA [SAR324 cluster bacterium]|jgi:trk system potassium uptake protein TrkA|nr:Trk system potassium transporter TrkA [SAR324 cluster bacterium]MEE1574786.1 Trk system potassium transporter TrkA [Deltaproteobacteria bacterium]MDP6248210.1 Trk system potassium transporter TrkA [SAR324 cluster bacterium]MDP6330669.1 Trk system potassium transporter TrkA [SAR324 cluster bacterium]MDP6463922.1 Trk system potassium transporter TrkA [SAR324 cluster bacterium]|tara:strand:- start:1608 stop:2996 length:1389 start_codon:yes stop_codon:yes gene_type:complete